MCHHCVTDSVKQRMLNRRDFFKAAPVAAAAAAVGATAPQALADGHGKIEDMTYLLSDAFPTYDGAPGIAMDQKFNFKEHYFNLFEVTLNEHTGTHMDAPLHFSEDGQSVDEIEVGNLVVPLACVDIRAKADASPDAQVTPDDLAAWKAANGDFPEKCCVAMLSGWGAHVSSGKFRNADGDGTMHFPGFHVEAATMLIEETSAIGMAVDTLSLDHGPSADFATHYAWLPTNRWGLENLANLEKVPAKGATLVVGAPKVKGGSGGPCRVFAMI